LKAKVKKLRQPNHFSEQKLQRNKAKQSFFRTKETKGQRKQKKLGFPLSLCFFCSEKTLFCFVAL
jgi:hypothetical protein